MFSPISNSEATILFFEYLLWFLFLIGKLRKKNCVGPMRSLFSLSIAQTEKIVGKACGKKSWNKLVKTSDVFVQEQMEEHEKMKRDIYLNGGYVDCVNPGCIDQGTAETSYLCKSCFHEQTVARKQQQPLSTIAKSTGWLTILQSNQ